VALKLTYNEEFLESTLENVINKVSTPVEEAKIEENDEGVFLVAGVSGIDINKESTIKKIVSLLHSGSNCTITLNTDIVEPKEIDIDKFHKLVNTEMKNAELKIVNNEDYEITPEITGKKITKSKLTTYVNKLKESTDEKILLPIEREIPEYTKEYIEENLFKDTIGKFETIYPVYNQSKLNRANNIKIASSKINNFILDVDENFSFNKTVGKRTVEEGYQSATAFMNGEMVQSIGGGICQVSSTLHCAALEAEQEIIERKNHTYLVSYVTPGMDAAVSYGSLDYKFKNTLNWPIKLKSKTTKDNKIVFEILGTKEDKDKEVSYYTQTVGTIASKMKYTDDPTLEEGKIVITEKGFNGLKVDTYKKIIIDGEVTENKLLYGSYYNAYDTRANIGTKKIATPTPTPTPDVTIHKTKSQTPKPTKTPVETTTEESTIDSDNEN
jgi:vancomycin resistance protein YoaR